MRAIMPSCDEDKRCASHCPQSSAIDADMTMIEELQACFVELTSLNTFRVAAAVFTPTDARFTAFASSNKALFISWFSFAVVASRFLEDASREKEVAGFSFPRASSSSPSSVLATALYMGLNIVV